MASRPSVLAIAGEPSADEHTALVGQELLARCDVDLYGVGQRAMRESGFELVYDSSDWGGIGVCESIHRFPKLLSRARGIARWCEEHRPDLLMLVDFGAFNVRFARMLRRKITIPTLYCFPPRSWSREASGYWRLGGLVERWACPFPWQAEIMQSEGLDATWVGHPVVDRISPTEDKAANRAKLGLRPEGPVLGLFPGSRPYEVRSNGPEMLVAARAIKRQIPDVEIMLSVAPSMPREVLEKQARRIGVDDLRLADGADDILSAADLAITSAGTVTLSLAAAGCPMIVMYRGTVIMRLEDIFRRLGRLTIGLPNIIADRKIVPEITGWHANGENLGRAALELLSDPAGLQQTREDLLALRDRLGDVGVSGRVAEIALEMLETGAGHNGNVHD